MTSSGVKVRFVRMLVPPLPRSNCFLSPTLKRRSVSLYVAASEEEVLEGWVACIMTTSKPMREKGTLQAPGSSEWSNLMEKSKGFNLGSEGTMLWVSHST
eukprot:scaffold239_cov62-Cyclotella_meneghiniana.AAC.2